VDRETRFFWRSRLILAAQTILTPAGGWLPRTWNEVPGPKVYLIINLFAKTSISFGSFVSLQFQSHLSNFYTFPALSNQSTPTT
jgi:hypothetical protein